MPSFVLLHHTLIAIVAAELALQYHLLVDTKKEKDSLLPPCLGGGGC
jgi:hypothetical protein